MGITKVIAKRLSYFDHNNNLTYNLRSRRISPLLRIIEDVYKKVGFVEIVDIGGYREYWEIVPLDFLVKHNVTITIVNLGIEPGIRPD